MTQKEITRLRVIDKTLSKVLTVREAAELLGLSERQVVRLRKGVREEGPAFIIHKNRGRKPKHAISDEIKESIVFIKNSEHETTNFRHFRSILEKHKNIKVSYSTVHRVLTEAGIKSPMKRRKKKSHHRRKRKPQKGMLVQIDASPHEWIPGLGTLDLHGAIDDATGDVLALYLMPNECMEGHYEIARQVITNQGRPLSFYCDKHTIFVSPKDGKLTIEEQLAGKTVNLTQFGRAMEELGINIIKANSPQAKGRVERLWGTLQSRLPVELKMRGITTIEEANAFLKEYIHEYNEEFGVKPEDPNSSFRELDPSINLDHILCIKDERRIIESSAFSFHGQIYQLIKKGKVANALPKAKLTVMTSSKIGIKAMYSGIVYDTRKLDERPKRASIKKDVSHGKKVQKVVPSENHPWKKPTSKIPIPSYREDLLYESDTEIDDIIKGLYNSTRAWV